MLRADVLTWVSKVGHRLETIPKIAANKVAFEVRRDKKAGGNMPVVSGNLRNSLRASTSSMPVANVAHISRTIAMGDNIGQVVETINNVRLGQTIYLGFVADYARDAELKHGFVRLTAQNWDIYVDAAVRAVGGTIK